MGEGNLARLLSARRKMLIATSRLMMIAISRRILPPTPCCQHHAPDDMPPIPCCHTKPPRHALNTMMPHHATTLPRHATTPCPSCCCHALAMA